MRPKVVTLGEAMLRLSPTDGARLDETDRVDVHVAGAEANVAAGLASLGVESTWISALPATPPGERIARQLRAAGVGLEFVEWTDSGRVGLFFVEFGASPRPTTVWYDRADSAFARMSEFDPTALAGASFAVTSGMTLALSESARKLATSFLERARAAGVGVCIDVNYRERLCSPDDAHELLEPLLDPADVVVCSRADAARVFDVRGERIEEVAESFRARVARGAGTVAITDGANGAAAVGESGVFIQAALPTEVVDRIGAGDAFLAGLLWGLTAEEGLEQSLRYASALGALACTVHGDLALFKPTEVRAAATEVAALVR